MRLILACLFCWLVLGTAAELLAQPGQVLPRPDRRGVNVQWYGAIPDDGTNDTSQIQAAIDSLSGGGTAFFPAGTYTLNATITVPEGVHLVGESRWLTRLSQTNLSTSAVQFSNLYGNLRSMTVQYSGTPLAGATAIDVTGSYTTLEDFTIRSAYTGILVASASAVRIERFDIYDYESVGIEVNTCNDVFIRTFTMNAGAITRGLLGGLRLQEKAEAVVVCDGDIINGNRAFTSDATVFGEGTRPAYNSFVNVYFDFGELGMTVNKCVEMQFTNCWFSHGRYGSGYPGCTVSNSEGILFDGCMFMGNGAEGCVVEATSSDITFTGSRFNSNSMTAGAGAAAGLRFADNCANFKVLGCTATNGRFAGQQSYGVSIGTGCADYVVVGNDVAGNLTGGILDNGTGPKSIHSNIGYVTTNRGTGTVTIGNNFVGVNHDLDVTPDIEDIVITPRSNPTASGVGGYWVSSPGATNFTVNTDAAVSGVDWDFSWSVRSKDKQ